MRGLKRNMNARELYLCKVALKHYQKFITSLAATGPASASRVFLLEELETIIDLYLED